MIFLILILTPGPTSYLSIKKNYCISLSFPFSPLFLFLPYSVKVNTHDSVKLLNRNNKLNQTQNKTNLYHVSSCHDKSTKSYCANPCYVIIVVCGLEWSSVSLFPAIPKQRCTFPSSSNIHIDHTYVYR